MPQIRLALADSDTFFLDKFSAYLRRNQSNHFNIELFTTPSTFEEWFFGSGKSDLTVISSTFFCRLDNRPQASPSVAILCDSPESLIPANYQCIEKFQPAENLVKDILSFCADTIPKITLKKGSSGDVHLVLYGDGSDALNPFAQTLAQVKASKGCSTLYISLDELSNTDSYFFGKNPKGLSEFLYYIKSQKENLSLKAEACTSRSAEYGLDFMKGHQNELDIAKISSGEVTSLVEAVREKYDDIVISRAFRHDALLPVLSGMAYRIYITGLNYRSSCDRLSKIANILTRMEGSPTLELDKKTRVCIELISRDNQPLPIDTPCFVKNYLPFPYHEDESLFAPSKEYLSVVEMIAAKERGVL